jgi:Protein of unknown function (DUF1153)
MASHPFPKFAGAVDSGQPFADGGGINDLDLPPPNTRRWVVRRKAAVVDAVERGVLSLDEACRRYRLSAEEFGTWQKLVQTYGTPGLRVTRLHTYRGTPSRG